MKRLIFSALFATVAISGAFAQSYYAAGATSPAFTCPTGISTCNLRYSSNVTVYPNASTNPPTTQGQGTGRLLSTIPAQPL